MAQLTESKGDCCDTVKSCKNGHPAGKNEDIQMETRGDTNNEEVEVEMIVPPDGGWGWVIVAASFMCNLCVDGIIFSFGNMLQPITDTLKVSKTSVAFAGSLQTAFYLTAGPFVSALANRYGFRLVAMTGSVISCLGFLASSYCESIELLFFTYGVLGGVGGGLIYVPAVITTGFYFERWRALATGIAVCGSGIGAFVVAPITEALIAKYEWRTAMRCQAALLLQCLIFGALFRPLRPKRIKVKQSEVTQENSHPEAKGFLMNNGVSTTSLHGSQMLAIGSRYGTNNNAAYPTAAEAIGSIPNIVVSANSLHNVVENEKPLSASQKRLSAPIYPEMDVVTSDEIKAIEEENNLLAGDLERLNGRIPTVRRHTISGRREQNGSQCSLRKAGKRHSISKDPQRPFYRDDIFYGGSLARLPHYKSQQSSVGYHMSVTRLPTATDVEEEESGKCYLCPESVRRILTTMLDLSLLKSPSFLILAVSGGLTMMGFYTPFMFFPDRAEDMGMSKDAGTYFISVIGITNTIGRIICGLVSSVPKVDTLFVNNVFISISGVLTMLSGLSSTEAYQYFYSSGFGLSISVFAALRSILVVEYMGLEKLTNAFGLMLLFQGVAAGIGAPLASQVHDLTESYDATFYLSGALILLSAVICYPLKRINEWENRRNNVSLPNP